jgi:hypothetical protein
VGRVFAFTAFTINLASWKPDPKSSLSPSLHAVEKLKAAKGNNLYYAAVGTKEQPLHDIPEQGIPIIPADIGLRIRLPDLAIECSEKGFTDYRSVYARELLEEIEYCSIS